MSFIGWLDQSDDEQRRVRELLQMFRDRGTVDDLGIGTLRDATSNRLFHGTSVIQTRARYFLFVPWIFRHAAQTSAANVLEGAECLERRLIGARLQADDQDGVIGRRVQRQMTSCAEAGFFLEQCGLTRLDGNGAPCESSCRR